MHIRMCKYKFCISYIISSGTFGSAAQENSTFANLANQSTLGFGSLAQNQQAAAPQQPPQFSG